MPMKPSTRALAIQLDVLTDEVIFALRAKHARLTQEARQKVRVREDRRVDNLIAEARRTAQRMNRKETQ